jgi:Tat protein translocase TatB subunit
MFGIGLPELILIMAVALIVVGPEKLPDLARGLAKQFFELKKAANVLKDSLQEEELLSNKPPADQASPIGFSRPEQLAAAALAAQGTKHAEPGSPRPEVLDLADAAPPPESVAAAPQVEPVTLEAEAWEESNHSEPKPTGETSGQADV